MIGVAVVVTDRQIDTDKTCYNVKKFFQNDFQRYLNLAGKHRTDLSSPQLDPTGVSAHGVNHQEEKLVGNFMWQTKVTAVSLAIKNCTDTPKQPYKTILQDAYLKELPVWQITEKIGYGKTRFSQLKVKAQVEFAERLIFWKNQLEIEVPDLIVYEKNS